MQGCIRPLQNGLQDAYRMRSVPSRAKRIGQPPAAQCGDVFRGQKMDLLVVCHDKTCRVIADQPGHLRPMAGRPRRLAAIAASEASIRRASPCGVMNHCQTGSKASATFTRPAVMRLASRVTC